MLLAEVPVIAIGPVPVHELITEPMDTLGGVLHETVRVAVAFVPTQPPDPKTVRVAVNVPAVEDEGVKVQAAGSVVLVLLHVPRPTPPVHATEPKLPLAAAPVIGWAAVPQVVVAVPTDVTVGATPQLTVIELLGWEEAQGPIPLAVRKAVKLPDEVLGV